MLWTKSDSRMVVMGASGRSALVGDRPILPDSPGVLGNALDRVGVCRSQSGRGAQGQILIQGPRRNSELCSNLVYQPGLMELGRRRTVADNVVVETQSSNEEVRHA